MKLVSRRTVRDEKVVMYVHLTVDDFSYAKVLILVPKVITND